MNEALITITKDTTDDTNPRHLYTIAGQGLAVGLELNDVSFSQEQEKAVLVGGLNALLEAIYASDNAA